MGADAVTISVVTAFWAVVGIILPFVVGRGPNKGVIQAMLMITAGSCWLFWLLAYMHQMNPLIGPNLHRENFYAIKYLWDGDSSFLDNGEGTTDATTDAITMTTSATTTASVL